MSYVKCTHTCLISSPIKIQNVFITVKDSLPVPM